MWNRLVKTLLQSFTMDILTNISTLDSLFLNLTKPPAIFPRFKILISRIFIRCGRPYKRLNILLASSYDACSLNFIAYKILH